MCVPGRVLHIFRFSVSVFRLYAERLKLTQAVLHFLVEQIFLPSSTKWRNPSGSKHTGLDSHVYSDASRKSL